MSKVSKGGRDVSETGSSVRSGSKVSVGSKKSSVASFLERNYYSIKD